MANTIKIKRGQSSNISGVALQEGELAVTLDTGELYVGDGVENKQIANDYAPLDNKPQINNVEVSGNKSLSDFGIEQIYIGTEEPTDPSVKVWINPEGEPTSLPNATETTVGGFKCKLVGTTLYITTDGSAPGA